MKTECDCMGCRALCLSVPGWFMPDEAERALDAGLAHKLALDDWSTDEGSIYVLSPADNPKTDRLSKLVRDHFGGGCIFHTDEGLCSIHRSGFKPRECREAFYCNPNPAAEDIRGDIAKAWDTTEGRGIIYRWRIERGA